MEFADNDIRHFEYLTIESFGDFAALAESLIAVVPAEGPIFCYSASFEDQVLRRLAMRVPLLAQALTALADRLIDLLLITRQAYYHRDMQGSWSIKSVNRASALRKALLAYCRHDTWPWSSCVGYYARNPSKSKRARRRFKNSVWATLHEHGHQGAASFTSSRA